MYVRADLLSRHRAVGSVDALMEAAQTPDFLQVHAGEAVQTGDAGFPDERHDGVPQALSGQRCEF